jgi:diguanylate cyclase (GGDEF)-like protein
VLLGRTGLDATLRLDPLIELVRVSTALEAVGEVASPDSTVPPERTVVVVSRDAEASLEDGSGSAHERLGDFVASLKLADPGALVCGLAPCNGTATLYDLVIPSPMSAAAFRTATMRQGPSRPGESPRAAELGKVSDLPGERAAELPASIEPRPAPMSTMPSSGVAMGDVVLVTMLLKGQEIQHTAVALLRERSGDDTLTFHAEGAASPVMTTSRGQPVAWEGVVYGHLTASRTPPGLLGQHARWLAGWLRLRDQQGQLRTAAFTDPLTGAWNRRYFDRFLEGAIDAARSGRRPVTILLFDIDNFKHYNDRYGHEAGDEILRETVRLLKSVIRPTDRVCRVGGDEFAVIFHEPEGPRQEGSKHPAAVSQIAHRFQQQVQKHRFPKLIDCAAGTLTISGGLATFPWDGATPAELLAKADQLAMASKRQGKNAITLGPGTMQS